MCFSCCQCCIARYISRVSAYVWIDFLNKSTILKFIFDRRIGCSVIVTNNCRAFSRLAKPDLTFVLFQCKEFVSARTNERTDRRTALKFIQILVKIIADNSRADVGRPLMFLCLINVNLERNEMPSFYFPRHHFLRNINSIL